MSRTALASGTGLSHASITAITHDLIQQKVITELEPAEPADARGRGRPATLVGFNRTVGAAALFEIDVNRTRLSLVDYRGVLVDRTETPITPTTFAEISPTVFLSERLQQLQVRNPAEAAALRRVAISVQGILDRDGLTLKWSPIAHLANRPLVEEL